MKRLGVAFGGGARGFAHVGVLRALRTEEELHPAVVAGTSAGAIIAALYAGGMSQPDMEARVRSFDWLHDIVNFTDTARSIIDSKHGGLVSNAKLGEHINSLLDGRCFEDLQIPLGIVAIDIESNTRVIFTTPTTVLDHSVLAAFLPAPAEEKPGSHTLVISDYDDIGMAVRASCAVPGIFRPVEIRGRRLLDGGIIDQVPVDVIKAMGADPTIGISLAMALMPDRLKNIGKVITGMIGILGMHQIRKSLDLADVGFQIEGIEKRSTFNPHQYDLIDIGETAMRKRLPRLKNLLTAQ